MTTRPHLLVGGPRRQRGVVLFVALIIMVAMSLAAVALIRSVDTTSAVIGNLAFRQASVLPANMAVESAAAALFSDADPAGTGQIADKTADLPAQNYFAKLQAGEDARGVPAALKTETLARTLSFKLSDKGTFTGDQSENRIYYVIERMCVDVGPATKQNCELRAPKLAAGGTVNEVTLPTPAPLPYYRVTVRVDGPQNTTSFVQAMLR
jgi:type IV pilus assembly protein PilX